MVAAAGNHVVSLHRDRVGALELPSTLAPLRLESSSVQSITRC
jgi:16S rRNA U516 pseudouridylate synthase RsuA-like enzyme